MTNLLKYAHTHVPVKYFLSSYRALSDGRIGVRHLEEIIEKDRILVSEWKIAWIGACAILRTAIDLFKLDGRSCLSSEIRREIKVEWKAIADQKDAHPIFWEFLRKERDNIVHDYQWNAYETWIKPDGSMRRVTSLATLFLEQDGARPFILMRSGYYAGRNSLELLNEGANWVEERVFSTIRRAGFNPDEYRNVATFAPRPTLRSDLMG